jgi:hypothetical protein
MSAVPMQAFVGEGVYSVVMACPFGLGPAHALSWQ